MESEALDFLLATGAMGIVCGVFIAMAFQRTRHPYFWTAVCGFVCATIVVMLASIIWQTTSAYTSYPLAESLIMGLVFSQIFLPVVPFCAGGPSVLAGLAAQWLLQRGKRRAVSATKDEQRDG